MIADPIADKALTGSALIGLSALGLGPWWVTVVILGREFGITLMRFWDLHDRITPASLGGKAKTVAQIAAIGLYLLPLAALLGAPVVIDVVRWALLPLAVTLTIVTGLDLFCVRCVSGCRCRTQRRRILCGRALKSV